MVHNKFTLQLLHISNSNTNFNNKIHRIFEQRKKSCLQFNFKNSQEWLSLRYPLKNTMEKRKVYESFVENREHT
jgi:hypothetical protein